MGDRIWRWYEKANDFVRTFTGPAQLGAGYPEPPEVRPSDPNCPICGQPMSRHDIIRAHDSRTSTRLMCPKTQAAP